MRNKTPSRRKFLGATAGAAALAAGPAALVLSGQSLPGEETLVLTNGRIHTMDAANTIATSVTIRNGRFVAVNAAPRGRPGEYGSSISEAARWCPD